MMLSSVFLRTCLLVSTTLGSLCSCSTVNTTSGTVSGVVTNLGLQFLGVKYGDAERFQASTLFTAPLSQVSATQLPPYCPQSGQSDISEDCLFLNIYVPDGNSTQLPVLVWVYGGSFQQGGSADPTFNGSLLAHEQNVIVVTFNYRLGSLGFYTDNLENPAPAVTDVVTALQWVHSNINAFGGDPSTVTIFGESSGATLIRAIATSPALIGLFSKVIIESDPQLAYEITAEQAKNTSSYVLQANQCTSTACLKAKTVQEILDGDAQLPQIAQLIPDHATFFNPWVDGKYVTGRFADLASSGKIPKRAFLLGTVKNESAAALAPLAQAASVQQLPPNTPSLVLGAALGNNPAAIGEILSDPVLFPQAGNSSELSTVIDLSVLTTKLVFECPTALNAQYLRKNGNPTYLFRFDQGIRYTANQGSPLCDTPTEVCHEDDLNLVFGNTDPSNELGKFTRHAWASFARSGTPGWSQLYPENEQLYSLGTGKYLSAGKNDAACSTLYNLPVYS